MTYLKRLVYPLVGAIIITGYAVTVSRGYDPAAVSDNKRVAPAGARAVGRHSSGRRRSTFIWFGGFGGK